MSDSGKNVGKSRSRPADAHESAADCGWRSERDFSTRGSSSLPPKGTECKYTEEEIYDSGIQSSECYFSSSDVISETYLMYPDSAPDCGYVDSGSLDQEDAARPTSGAASKDSSSKELPSSKESEGDASRGPDSGVVDYDPSSESEDAPSRWDGVVPDCWKVSSESHTAESVKSEDAPSRWDEFFEPADDEGNTHLHLAIIQGCEPTALLILSQIPESRYLDIKNHRRETCLHLSVLLRRPYITRKLLLAGAKTGCEDKNGNTALHLACKMNNLACVEALLNKTLIYRDMVNTVFMYKPKIDLPHMYINEWNYDGLTCTHLAAVHRDFDVLYQLFVNGCDVNIRECKAGYTILHTAVVSGRVELVKFIFQHKNLNKINTEIRNYARLTAYQLSADYPQIASILAENGAIQLSTLDDESEDDDWSDESSDDESFENCEIGSVSQMINNLINSAIPSVITTAS